MSQLQESYIACAFLVNLQNGSATDEVDDSKNADMFDDFEVFFKEMRKDAKEMGLPDDVSEEDAREMFSMLQNEFAEGLGAEDAAAMLDELSTEEATDFDDSDSDEEADDTLNEANFNEVVDDTVEEAIFDDPGTSETPDAIDEELAAVNGTEESYFDNAPAEESHIGDDDAEYLPSFAGIDHFNDLSNIDDAELEKIEELQTALPGLPLSRIRKVAKAFENTLGYPSLLTLVPILRESIPDFISLKWLRRHNVRNANYAFQKAEEDGVVDKPLLNGMLQVLTSTSALDAAEKFHAEEFRRRNMVRSQLLIRIEVFAFLGLTLLFQKPTVYSDRLVFQMLIANKELVRALDFKRKIEGEKRKLDIASYGTLTDYYARTRQLGSAMMTLNECRAIHGSVPNEKYISSTRRRARKLGMYNELELQEFLGEDPTEWLWYLKRYVHPDKSKKTNRWTKFMNNRILNG